jgi:hypothetical protein
MIFYYYYNLFIGDGVHWLTTDLGLLIYDETHMFIDSAKAIMSGIFALTLCIALIAFIVIRYKIVGKMNKDTNNVAELLFSVPRKFVQDYPAFQKCLDSGGASLLESSDT